MISGGHHLEYIAVGLAEEKSFKRCFPQGGDQLGTVLAQTLPERGKPGEWVSHGEMSAKLRFERAGGESLDKQQVQFLSGGDSQPRRLHGNVVRPVDRLPAEGLGEKPGCARNIAGREGEMQDRHGTERRDWAGRKQQVPLKDIGGWASRETLAGPGESAVSL